MAFLFSSLSSTIVKRLLLFAISRLDILDQDPANLFDVAVGKKSTIELRDVGLRVKRLSSLLQLELPPELQLEKARVSSLRLSLSLDAITVEINGIQLHARLADSGEKRKAPSKGKRRASPSRAQSRHSSPQDSAGSQDDDGSKEIPTAHDLAKSFLEEEPEGEREELEAAFQAQSRHMSESGLSEVEDDEAVGMGTAPNLPAFLERYIMAAMDRSEIVINGIDLKLATEVPSPAKPLGVAEQTEITLNFYIERAAIDGLGSGHPEVELTGDTADIPRGSINVQNGKRRLSLKNIGARIISESDVLATLSRTSALSRPPSSLDTRSEVSSTGPRSPDVPSSSTSAFPIRHTTPPSSRCEKEHTVEQNSEIQHQPIASSAVLSSSLLFEDERGTLAASAMTTDEDRFADALDDDDRHHQIEHGQHGDQNSLHVQATLGPGEDSVFGNAGFMQYVVDNNVLDSEHESLGAGSSHFPSASALLDKEGFGSSLHSDSPSVPRITHVSETSPSLLRRADPSASPMSKDHDSLSRSEPQRPGTFYSYPREEAAVHSPQYMPLALDKNDGDMSPMSSRSSHSSSGASLSESRIFTHEDAESMYLSAMSATPAERSARLHLPGGWDSASSSSGSSSSPTLSRPHPSDIVDVDEGCETPRPGSRVSAPPQEAQNARTVPRSASFTRAVEPSPTTSLMSKSILRIDNASVWFPWPLLGLNTDPVAVEQASGPNEDEKLFSVSSLADVSAFSDMPGYFSQYAQSTAPRRAACIREGVPGRRPALKSPVPQEVKPCQKNYIQGFEIEIGSIHSCFDFPTARMFYQVIERLTALFSRSDAPAENRGTSEKRTEPQRDSEKELKVAVNEFTVALVENLRTDHYSEDVNPTASVKTDDGVIVRTRLKGLDFSVKAKVSETRISIGVQKFAFGLANQDILSFDASARLLQASVRDLNSGEGKDISLQITLSKQGISVEAITLPLCVHLDVQSLDEALGSFGGFSGILELSNSITSNSTINSRSPKPTQKPKGVHFDVAPEAPSSGSLSRLRTQIRLGGVLFILQGKTCSVQLHTSAVKTVTRGQNVTLQIDEMNFSGPHHESSGHEPAMVLELSNTRVQYLFTPEESDLEHLLSLITPSKDKYPDDDDILLDTLLRQRRKGSVLRVNMKGAHVDISDLQDLQKFSSFGEELARLSTVTKYLPEDDRPGILTLAHIDELGSRVMVNDKIGAMDLTCKRLRIGHVGLPALLATEVGQIFVRRGEDVLIDEVCPLPEHERSPMIMSRMVGDELDPTIRVKLFNTCFEYQVSTLMAALGLPDPSTPEEIATGIASSIATLTAASPSSPIPLTRKPSDTSSTAGSVSKLLHVNVRLRDCALGLNPRGLCSKGLFVLTETRFDGAVPKNNEFNATLDVNKAYLLVIDDIARLAREPISAPSRASMHSSDSQIANLCASGYVSLGTISSAEAVIKASQNPGMETQALDIEFNNKLIVLESCADSTQTMIAVLNGLKPPSPPSTDVKYRTKPMQFEDMMASFSGDAFAMPSPTEPEDESLSMESADKMDDEVPTNLEFVGSFYNPESLPTPEDLGDSMLEGDLDLLSTSTPEVRNRGEKAMVESFQDRFEIAPGENALDFDQSYFGKEEGVSGHARQWDSKEKRYVHDNPFKSATPPLQVRIRHMHIIWNLYDGYDWERTRDTFEQAVQKLEARAEEKRHRRATVEDDDPELTYEQDFLFNSVWIGLPVNEEKGALTKKINHEIDDFVSETGSYATTNVSRATARSKAPKKHRKLKLERSKHSKITFELKGVSADIIVFPPDSGEAQSSVDVRVYDLEIFDHILTSTWKKFLTYMHDAGERQMGRPMLHLELLNVKTVQDLAATELVVKVTVLPLRLHVDQDALDFITRFFEFKDDSVASAPSAPSEEPFIQRLEVNKVLLKLDYKPKRIDYAGLRSGHTTEFMNFIILDGADIVLQHIILYGLTGFNAVHEQLNSFWMANVKEKQLPTVLSGLAPVRPLVNVGSGVKKLVTVPIEEYKKDGRVIRSIQKGATAFARSTTSELARFGARIAMGTHTALSGAETLLSPESGSPGSSHSYAHHEPGWEEVTTEPETGSSDERRAYSAYADQPLSLLAGLRGAARSLERDLLTARDAIIAVPAEVMESGSASGAARAISRRAPTIILRPAVGVTKALGTTLLGAGNALDKDSRRKVEDKYKRR